MMSCFAISAHLTVSFAYYNNVGQWKPILFVGSVDGKVFIFDFDSNTFQPCPSKSINCKDIVAAADWLDAANVYYAIGDRIHRWCTSNAQIEQRIIENSSSQPRKITCFKISAVAPFLMAIGFEGGEIIVMNCKLKLDQCDKLHHFLLGHHDVCNVNFPELHTSLLLSVARDGHLRVFDLKNGSTLVKYNIYNSSNQPAQFVDKNFFASLFLPSINTNRPQLLFSGRRGCLSELRVDDSNKQLVNRIALNQPNSSHSSNIFALSTANQYTYEWADGELIARHELDLPSIAISSSYDSFIIWDLDRHQAISKTPSSTQIILQIDFNPFDRHMASILCPGSIIAWDMSDGCKSPYTICFKSQTPERIKLSCIEWHPKKIDVIAVGCCDGSIRVFDFKKPTNSIYNFESPKHGPLKVYKLCWGTIVDENGEKKWSLYVVHSVGVLRVHDLTGQIFTLSELALSYDEDFKNKSDCSWNDTRDLCAIGRTDGGVEIFDFDSSRGQVCLKLLTLVENLHTKYIQCLVWHSSMITDHEAKLHFTSVYKNYLAIASAECHIDIISPNQFDNSVIRDSWRRLIGHKEDVKALAWCPSREAYLASCSNDCTVQIWNVAAETDDEKMVGNYRGHWSPIFAIAWCPFQRDSLFSGGYDKSVHMFSSVGLTHRQPPDTCVDVENNANDITGGDNAIGIDCANEKLANDKNDQKKDETEHKKNGKDHKKNEKFKKSKASVNTSQHLTTEVAGATSQKKKALFPLSNFVENCSNRVQHMNDIRYLLTKQGASIGSKAKVDNQECEDRCRIFGDRQEINKLVTDESKNHFESGNLSNFYIAKLSSDDLQTIINEATRSNRLDDFLVSLSATISTKFHRTTSFAYARQLRSNGEPIKAALILLHLSKIIHCINTLVGSGLFKEALVIIRCHSQEEQSELVEFVLEKWAADREKLGFIEVAVKIHLTNRRYDKAAALLRQRADDDECRECADAIDMLAEKYKIKYKMNEENEKVTTDEKNDTTNEKILKVTDRKSIKVCERDVDHLFQKRTVNIPPTEDSIKSCEKLRLLFENLQEVTGHETDYESDESIDCGKVTDPDDELAAA